MSDKNFKVKNGLSIQGTTTDTLITADNNGGILVGGSALGNGYQLGNTASRPASPSLGQIYSNTQTGYIEVYTSVGWSQLGVIPVTPTIGTATDVGTNIAYGVGSASITFTPAATGGLPSSYTATSTSGGYSGTSSTSPVVVSNIPTGTSATFTITATNGYGNALATTASNSITTTSIPQVPTIGTATATTGIAYGSAPTASLTFTAGATGGKTISNYKYSVDDSTYTALSPEDVTSPVTIPGLTAGQSYTIKLKAVNANGDSIATSASNSILAATVPQSPTIGTTTVTNSTTVSIPFTAGSTGGSAITSYTVTSSPSIALSVSGTTSPLTVTGTFAGGTEYTFTITATNAYGTSSSSSSSNSVLPLPAYALAETFNSTGNYTIPSGKTKLAIFAFSGGGSGGTSGNTNDGYAASGGSGSRGAAFQEYDVTSGQVIGITVGSSNGSTVINSVTNSTNLATVSLNTGTSNLPNFITVAGGGGGGGGRGAQGDTHYSAQYNPNIMRGNAGAAGSALALSLAGLGSVSYTTGSGGGGGGSGGRVYGPNNGYDGRDANGGTGGARNGNSGGGGGGGYAQADATGRSSGGGAGENANWAGANLLGGGGAGGSGGAGYGAGNSSISSGGSGGAGSDGKVYVYVR